MWYDVPYVYLQDAALQSNYPEDKSSYLISVVGFFNMIGNIVLGYMGDKDWANATVVYGVCMALCGGSMMLIPCLMDWNYWSLAAGCAVFGLTIAANYSLTSVILVKVVSLERFANAYGLLLLVQGIGNLVGPPIAGVIYDMTGTNSWSFLVAGGGVLASSIFILAPKVFRCRQK
jgi:MFS family permease